MVKPVFKENDYIINRKSGEMGIIKGVTKKGYYQFKVLYGPMFDELKDVKDKNYDMQVNYQKFYDICTDDEKKKLDKIIAEHSS